MSEIDSFKIALEKKISESRNNNFGKENFDQLRFGNYDELQFGKYDHNAGLIKKVLFFIKKNIKRLFGHRPVGNNYNQFDLGKYETKLHNLYTVLSDKDKKLLVELIAYRLLGYTKVMLSNNTDEYWETLARAKSAADLSDSINPGFMHFVLYKFNLNSLGYDIQLYFNETGVAVDFIAEQYAYKCNGKIVVGVEENDVVLDLGGCWGDTALYFANKSGMNGEVYSFEFIPDNIGIFNKNIEINPQLGKRIKLIQNPVWSRSGEVVYFADKGPASRVEFEPFEGQTGITKTVSIDDFVKAENLSKVDFIKMDIEGGEPEALKGALETIKKYRPKLAIACYHSIDDFVDIPAWILSLDLGYDIFLGHYTIHAEETVCFAAPIG